MGAGFLAILFGLHRHRVGRHLFLSWKSLPQGVPVVERHFIFSYSGGHYYDSSHFFRTFGRLVHGGHGGG